MYRFSANSRATISSTAIFFSQQSRQYRSSPRGSETSFAPQSAHFDFVRFDLRVATLELYGYAGDGSASRDPPYVRGPGSAEHRRHAKADPADQARITP